MSNAEATGYAEDEIPLVLWAAVRHPDGSVRSGLRQAMGEWIATAKPRYSRQQISSFLRSQEGTAIEPFVLNEQDLELAELLIQYAFSELGNQTRFRVVSRETLGAEGGVMLTDNLHGYYIERYARGFRTKTPAEFGFIAPAEMPDSDDPQAQGQPVSAMCRFEETGLSITVSGVNWAAATGLSAWETMRLLQQNSHVFAADIPFTQLGLRIAFEGDAVRIRTGSPESLLRVSAHMMQRSALVLTPERTGPRARVFVRLLPPGEDTMALPVAVTCTSRSIPEWLRLPGADGIPLSDEDRLAIARWFRPHDGWMNEQFLEALT